MKIIETIFTQLTDTDTLLESVQQAIADLDPDYEQELAAYLNSVQVLTQEVPWAEDYLEAMRQELVSDVRFALWQGFMWNLDCFRNPVNKLLVNVDFEELCQESRMHTLPAAQTAMQKSSAFLRTAPEDKQDLLDPIIDYYAYLKTYAYKLAHYAGFSLANKLLPLVVPGYITDPGLSMRYGQQNLYACLPHL